MRLRVTLGLLLTAPLFSVTAAMAFSDPVTVTDLTFNGSARLLTGRNRGSAIWLTPAQDNEAGSVFTTNSIAFSPSYRFSTFFQFQMTDPSSGGASDGIAFVLQTEGATALGGKGGYLGYGGITPSIAVEFDTWQNPGWDINDNHVAILLDGRITGLDPQTPYGVTNCQPTGAFGCMSNGDVWSVWIDYDGINLNVALADNSLVRPANLISFPINIPALLGQTNAFVGFTAGTGAGSENHFVANWKFVAVPADSQ